MNEKNYILIKNINRMILEMHKKTKDLNEEEFYKNIELTNTCTDYIFKINDSIKDIDNNIKNNYENINWNIIQNNMYYDEVFNYSIKMNKVWELSNKTLYDELYIKLEQTIEKK